MLPDGGDTNADPSVHLTVGVDTHIWGLNFASLRDNSLKKSGLPDKILLTKLEDKLYWDLQVRVLYACCVCFIVYSAGGECYVMFSSL